MFGFAWRGGRGDLTCGRAFATMDYAHIRFQVLKEADLPSFLDKAVDGRIRCGRGLIERLIELAAGG